MPATLGLALLEVALLGVDFRLHRHGEIALLLPGAFTALA